MLRVLAAVTLVGPSSLAVGAEALPLSGSSALQAARKLRSPQATATEGGELEGYEFWEEHDDLLKRAWRELGPRHADLYVYGPTYERKYIRQELRDAVAQARAGNCEAAVHDLLDEIIPGVFASEQFFTEQFQHDMLEELEHIQSSRIPQRRPNGMNRYGVILDQVGHEAAIAGLINDYLRPIATMLFPELVAATDAEEHYAFTVRYEVDGDTELAKHGDASVVTINLCLGRPGWRGGQLRFFDSGGVGLHALPNTSAGSGDVEFRPGMVVFHIGQHKHQALPLEAGERTNIIVWLMGRHGVVRIAPYPLNEQLTPSQRWAKPEFFSFEL